MRAEQPQVIVFHTHAFNIYFTVGMVGELQVIAQAKGSVVTKRTVFLQGQALNGGTLIATEPQVITSAQHRRQTIAYVFSSLVKATVRVEVKGYIFCHAAFF